MDVDEVIRILRKLGVRYPHIAGDAIRYIMSEEIDRDIEEIGRIISDSGLDHVPAEAMVIKSIEGLSRFEPPVIDAVSVAAMRALSNGLIDMMHPGISYLVMVGTTFVLITNIPHMIKDVSEMDERTARAMERVVSYIESKPVHKTLALYTVLGMQAASTMVSKSVGIEVYPIMGLLVVAYRNIDRSIKDMVRDLERSRLMMTNRDITRLTRDDTIYGG
jgi:hypothetical protein